MSYGYSNSLAVHIKEQAKADPSNPLFALASICVDRNIVPSEIAARISVSKQTIYDYLQLKYSPKPEVLKEINQYLKVLRKSKVTTKA